MTDATARSSGPKATPAEAMARFAAPDTPPEVRRDALTTLITSRVLPKDADDEAVRSGRNQLLLQANAADDSPRRLLAIAECMRLTQVVKRWAADTARQLAPAFAEPLPPMQLLADADDRLNLARACAQMSAPWLPAYLAQGIAEEESGEKARTEAATALLAMTPTLAESLRLLAHAFQSLSLVTESPADTVGRRLTRTLVALRSGVSELEKDAGDALGDALHALLADPFARHGQPEQEKVQTDLSREVLLTVHEVVRTRMSAVVDPAVYKVVSYCRKLCGGGSWPRELGKPLERLITDVTEALVLLGRQERCDQRLRDQLDVLVNHKERAQAIARELSLRHPDLPEDVRHWLEFGRLRATRASSTSASETVFSRADESIGLALQAARDLQRTGDDLRAPLAASLDVFDPALARPVAQLLDSAAAVAIQIEQAAAVRSLDLLGTPGQEIEFSPKYFTVVGDEPRQRMLVRQPAVVRKRADGSLGDVVTKGLVE